MNLPTRHTSDIYVRVYIYIYAHVKNIILLITIINFSFALFATFFPYLCCLSSPGRGEGALDVLLEVLSSAINSTPANLRNNDTLLALPADESLHICVQH